MSRERTVVLTTTAARQLRQLSAYAQRIIINGIRTHWIDNDPLEITRSKFRLRRPSVHTDYELRLENWRIFYRVEEEGGHRLKMKIALIGEKQGSRLIIEGEVLTL